MPLSGLPGGTDGGEDPIPLALLDRIGDVDDKAIGVDLLTDDLRAGSGREGPDGHGVASDDVRASAQGCGVPECARSFRLRDADPLVPGVRHTVKAQVWEAVRPCCCDRARRRITARRRAKNGGQEQAPDERAALASGHLTPPTGPSLAQSRTSGDGSRFLGEQPLMPLTCGSSAGLTAAWIRPDSTG